MMVPKRILPAIVISQFFCTSLWFAGNAVISDLIREFELSSSSLGYLTSAVQFGFITGTLLFAIFAFADRFSPSKVFFTCALLGCIVNLGTVWKGNNLLSVTAFRFLTGFFLAGIYPVGMKIAADYFDTKLGKSLGLLVGALVLGTAFPHFLNAFTGALPWKFVIITTSFLSFLGGILILFLVPDGPFRQSSPKIKVTAFFKVFKNKPFRNSAFGYFGHMWELYTFWAFVPFIITNFNRNNNTTLDVSLNSFLVISVGSISCIIGGILAHKYGSLKIAKYALSTSAICCLLSPLIGVFDSSIFMMILLTIWGISVIPDSPLFSTLVAQNAPPKNKGTALTIVNNVGFAITIVSIQLITYLVHEFNPNLIFPILAIGPIFGLIATRNSGFNKS